ncbi:uncharacterized protein LOC123723901 [Tachysurus ichikawai]
MKGGCVVCGDEKHREIFFCKRFKELKPVEKLGACKKCLVCHGEEGECKDTYLCRNKGFKKDHHFFLCLKGDFKRSDSDRRQSNVRRLKLTEEQEEFVSKLSPEMTEIQESIHQYRCKDELCCEESAWSD